MAKKKKTTKKTTKKRVAKTRKPNRYNEIRKVVSKYCIERYNHRCTNEELNRVYREIKSRYFDKKKSPPLREIIRNIDVILQFKDNNSLPTDKMIVQWFGLIEELGTNDGLFFKPNDELTFDFENVGLGVFKVKYKNLGKVYYDEIYPQMRDFIKKVETEKGLNLNSPVPELVFDQKSDQKNRKFKWKLELNDVNNQSIANAVVGKVPKTMKKAKPPTQSDIVKRNEQRNEALRMLQKNFDDGIYNVEEFKELRKEIMDKYKQGGQIDG